MRKSILFAAAALIISSAPAAYAQNGNAAAAPAASKLSPEQIASVQRAAVIMRTFSLAFESKDVQQAVKGQLLRCLYNNKLADISAATQQVFAGNPNLKPEDATTVYRTAAGVCGVTFRPAGSPPPANGAKPVAPSGDSR